MVLAHHVALNPLCAPFQLLFPQCFFSVSCPYPNFFLVLLFNKEAVLYKLANQLFIFSKDFDFEFSKVVDKSKAYENE